MSTQTVWPLQSGQENAPEDVGVRLQLLTSQGYHQLAQREVFGQTNVELIAGEIYLKHTAKPWRWSRSAYHRAADYGIFAPAERLELIQGRVYLKLPQTARHTQSLRAAAEALAAAFGPGYDVRQQLPLVLAEDGEPEPDLTVVPGTWRDYPAQPTQDQALLVVEISDTTLRFDRREKAALYAQAGIRDYWIVNIQDRTLEIRRDPAPVTEDMTETAYRSVLMHQQTDHVAPLTALHASIAVADLLPPLFAEHSPIDELR